LDELGALGGVVVVDADREGKVVGRGGGDGGGDGVAAVIAHEPRRRVIP
jgi:hypothetical protein